MTIAEVLHKYKGKIDYLDLEVLIASSLGKTREFVLTYPEYEIPKTRNQKLETAILRRIAGEPIAYILGHKEFYGLDFIVDKHTLVPRPETEMIVEQVIELLRSMLRSTTIIDIGTGSGNIITSVAYTMEHGTWSMEQKKQLVFLGTDISADTLKIAKKNARAHGVAKKIKFLQGSLLEPFLYETKKLTKLTPNKLVITANLPYLSKEIYASALVDVKNFEPRSALYSAKSGLAHYEKLLHQLKNLASNCYMPHVTCYMEISPEQKKPLTELIKSILPEAKISFTKDLAGKWRVCKIIC